MKNKKMLLVIILCVVVVGVVVLILLGKDSTAKSYEGTWKLQTQVNIGSDELLIDEVLEISPENVFVGMGLKNCNSNGGNKWEKRCPECPPQVLMNEQDDIVAINFITPNGNAKLLCFENDGDTMTQIKCGQANGGTYKSNGGIDEELNVIYKKVK